MSRIFFCGDVHGRFDHITAAVWECRPAAIVLLGDLQPQRALEVELASILGDTEVWFIHGNHDTDSDADHDHVFEQSEGGALAGRNLHGRVAEVAGVRIAGLGGVFRGQVWRPPDAPRSQSPEDYLRTSAKASRWRGGLPRKHRSTIFSDIYAALAKQRADVLVTHEAPSAHPHGFEAIDTLARALHASKTFHGHHHDRLDYSGQRDRLGFHAQGVGLRGITDLKGQVICAGELDAVRAREVRPV